MHTLFIIQVEDVRRIPFFSEEETIYLLSILFNLMSYETYFVYLLSILLGKKAFLPFFTLTNNFFLSNMLSFQGTDLRQVSADQDQSSMLKVICNQRDRFRARLREAEEV